MRYLKHRFFWFASKSKILYIPAFGEPSIPNKREMRTVANLLQALSVVVLILAALLMVFDPRLRNLVVEDLSLLNPWAKSSEGEGTTSTARGSSQSDTAKQGAPTVTEGGYAIAAGCALWSVEGRDLYYSPSDPEIICVQAPGSLIQVGSPLLAGAEMPPNCDVAPDLVVYCVAGEQLTADTLRAFYDRGELQTPHEPRGNGLNSKI